MLDAQEAAEEDTKRVAEAEAEANEWSWYSDGTVERELGEELRGAKAIRMESLTKYRCGGSSLVTRVSFGVLLRQMKVMDELRKVIRMESLTKYRCGGSSLVTRVGNGVLLCKMEAVDELRQLPMPSYRADWPEVHYTSAPASDVRIIRLEGEAIARPENCKFIHRYWVIEGDVYSNLSFENRPYWYMCIHFGVLHPLHSLYRDLKTAAKALPERRKVKCQRREQIRKALFTLAICACLRTAHAVT
jgi:hypothetical protein